MTVIASASVHTVNNTEENLKTFDRFIEEAASKNVDLILFPESSLQGLWDMMAFKPDAFQYFHDAAELVPEGPSTQHLIKKAREKDMYIAWSMTEQDPDRFDVIYNTCVLVGPEGYVGSYRKVHHPLTERLYIYPGNEFKVFDTKIGKIGMMVCFDLAYPEAARIMAIKGAQLILCPTGWPGEEDQLFLYKALNTARAMENQVFLMTSTTCGELHGGGCAAGHSCITGPNGQLLDTTEMEEGMAIAEIDLEQDIIKAQINTFYMDHLLKDRRPDTYGELAKITKYSFMNGPGAVGCEECCK